MSFFANGAVNRVNLHFGVQALAQSAGGIFFVVFLLRAGLSVTATLEAMAALVAGRFILRPTLVPLARWLGLKSVLVAGAIFMGLQYPLLAAVRGLDPALAALITVSALGDVLYWPAFNAYFASVSDATYRGRQVAARAALAAVAEIAGPLAGAAALVITGPGITFALVGLIQAASALPLLGAPPVAVRASAPGAFRAARLTTLFYLSDGWFDACWITVWQIALYVSLGHSIPAYGGVMALAGLAGAAGGLLIGPRIDAGHGHMAVAAVYGLGAVIVVVRAASLTAPWLAVGGAAIGALFIPILSPTIGGAGYNLAQASPCPLRFQVAAEAGWDVGFFCACLLGAALLTLGAPLAVVILLALPALLAGALLLRRMYAAS